MPAVLLYYYPHPSLSKNTAPRAQRPFIGSTRTRTAEKRGCARVPSLRQWAWLELRESPRSNNRSHIKVCQRVRWASSVFGHGARRHLGNDRARGAPLWSSCARQIWRRAVKTPVFCSDWSRNSGAILCLMSLFCTARRSVEINDTTTNAELKPGRINWPLTVRMMVLRSVALYPTEMKGWLLTPERLRWPIIFPFELKTGAWAPPESLACPLQLW